VLGGEKPLFCFYGVVENWLFLVLYFIVRRDW
jgi:hypothetical protein